MTKKTHNHPIILLQPPAFGLARGKGSPSLPLALIYAASMLSPEVKPHLLDLRLSEFGEAQAHDWRSRGVLCFALTAITGVQAAAASRIARSLREWGVGPIVWGGKHATLFGEDLIRSDLADIAVVGDGEETFARVVEALLAKGPLDGIAGLWHRRDGNPSFTGAREPFKLERIDHLPFSLLAHDYLYVKAGRRAGVLETSRGCPGRCAYCYLSARPKPYWQGAPAIWVAARLDELRERYPSMNHVDFVDDNFFADRNRALAIADILSQRHRGLSWTSNGGRLLDLVAFSNEELQRLRAAGLDRVDIGVETGSPRMAEMINKMLPTGEVLAQVRRLKAIGITPWINLMSGFPGETDDDLAQTIDLGLAVTAAGALISPIYAYAPYPGTKLAAQVSEDGWHLPEPSDLASGSWSRSLAPWIDRRRAARLETIYTASLFLDDKLEVYRPGVLSRLALKMLKPLARWRLRRKQFGLPIEKWLLRGVLGRDL